MATLPFYRGVGLRKIHPPLQRVERVTGTNLVSPQPRFAASLGLQAPNGSKPLRLAPGRTLQIHGTSLDTIACSCASFSETYERSSYRPERVARACIRLLKEMRLLLEEHQSSTADRAIPLRTQAVWRTSVADTEMTQSWDRARRSENFGGLYKRLYSDNFPSKDMLEEESLKEHFTMMDLVNIRRRPFISAKGYLGLGPEQAAPGDSIVAVCGADMPFVMQGAQGLPLIFVGDAYVDGVMDGQLAATNPLTEIFHID
ncbi:hypothetical protein MMC15_003959 [Xylographa vitiligo]|nr:hypothetical protein [Xylographa vitiligo]